jgi:UDP-2,4-diacetamido-2,4,6-trideoxy-beta-L-altropyranose hydrolase
VCRLHQGHLVDVIRERGFDVVALTTGRDEWSGVAQPSHGAWLGTDWKTDAAETSAALGNETADWLIVDHYALDARWERELRPFCKRLLTIDDLADREHDCDLLLDQNLGRAAEDYARLTPKAAHILTGARYALLRPEFGALRAESLAGRSKRKLSNILVTMGGVDQFNVTERVLEELECALPETISVTVVMGGKAPWLESVRVKAAGMRRPTKVLVDTKDMARLMVNCDLAIGAAGTTSWERLCLGLPTIVIALAENQTAVAATLAACGAALNAGVRENGPILAAQAALNLFHHCDALRALAKAGSCLCDGEGTRRVTEHLLFCQGEAPSMGGTQSLSLRLAGDGDRDDLLNWRNEEETRRNSRYRGIVSAVAHHKWFAASMADPKRLIFVAEMGGTKCGMVRFDLSEIQQDFWRVSVVVSPDFRGRGIGRALLDQACAKMARHREVCAFVAEVRVHNIASKRIFDQCAFEIVAESDGFYEMWRVLNPTDRTNA